MPVNTAVRAVVRSPAKATPLGVLCLRVGAFTLQLQKMLTVLSDCGSAMICRHPRHTEREARLPEWFR